MTEEGGSSTREKREGERDKNGGLIRRWRER